jgi:NADH-quinone oxidoreductase subunit N
MGKLYIFSAAIQTGYIGLAVLGVLNSVISAYYYLRISVVMYMSPGQEPPDAAPVVAPALALALLLAAWGTLQFGLFPSGLLDAALQSVAALLG